MKGFIPKLRTKRVESALDRQEGYEAFWAEIVTSLTFKEVESIELDGSLTYAQLFKAIAPYVIDWNALGRNAETGAYERLPSPAEAGPDVLRAIEPELSLWLAFMLRAAPFLPSDQPQAPAPSEEASASETAA